MTPTDPLADAALAELLRGSAPGPWRSSYDDTNGHWVVGGSAAGEVAEVYGKDEALLMCWARNQGEAVLSRLAAAEVERDEARTAAGVNWDASTNHHAKWVRAEAEVSRLSGELEAARAKLVRFEQLRNKLIPKGFGRRNIHCSNCGDERGGPFGHETSECRYRANMAAFEVVELQPEHRRGEFWDVCIDRYLAMEMGEFTVTLTPKADEPAAPASGDVHWLAPTADGKNLCGECGKPWPCATAPDAPASGDLVAGIIPLPELRHSDPGDGPCPHPFCVAKAERDNAAVAGTGQQPAATCEAACPCKTTCDLINAHAPHDTCPGAASADTGIIPAGGVA